ncbi:MAG: hypothetical protein RLZZ74_3468 [Cyanobacteriota bacterium]|jgi:hypothetical protein
MLKSSSDSETFKSNFKKCTKTQKRVIYAIRDNNTIDSTDLGKLLDITRRTVDDHLENIYEKFGLKGNKNRKVLLFSSIAKHLVVVSRKEERRTIDKRIIYPFKSIFDLQKRDLSHFIYSKKVIWETETIKRIKNIFAEELNNENYQIQQNGADCSMNLIIEESLESAYKELFNTIVEVHLEDLILTTANVILKIDGLQIKIKEKRRKE